MLSSYSSLNRKISNLSPSSSRNCRRKSILDVDTSVEGGIKFLLQEEIEELFNKVPISTDLLELRNLIQVSILIIKSALERKESRGLHYSLDYPHKLPQALDTYL